jgi:hypothetical protein
MKPEEGVAFVKRHGIVLQAARGPVPSLAEAIAGGPIRGSWWGHPKGHEIFRVAQAICESPEVLVCKFVEGKVTYIHCRLWPALVKLASHFRKDQLAKVWDEHTKTGAHRLRRMPFPKWVPDDIAGEAEKLSLSEAKEIFSEWLPSCSRSTARGGKSTIRSAPRRGKRTKASPA